MSQIVASTEKAEAFCVQAEWGTSNEYGMFGFPNYGSAPLHINDSVANALYRADAGGVRWGKNLI